MSASVFPLEGTTVAVLADCHIHPGGGPEFPAALLDALAGVDVIVTLGDMGERAGLDQLAAIAPVIGVRGQDDSDDPRTASQAMVLTGGGLAFGCVFDAVTSGLASAADPFAPAPDFEAVAQRLFGRPIDVLLHAGTHKHSFGEFAGGTAYNPGSAVLPAEGEPATFLRLKLAEGGLFVGEVVRL